MTGIPEPKVYRQLAVQIVASINRIKPQPEAAPALESALLGLLGTGGLFGVGARKGSASQTLRVAAVQALGFVGTGRSRKALAKLSTDQNVAVVKAASEALKRLTGRSVYVSCKSRRPIL